MGDEHLRELEREVDHWRNSVPRQLSGLRNEARELVNTALAEFAGGGEVDASVIGAFDASDPDIALDFEPHESEVW